MSVIVVKKPVHRICRSHSEEKVGWLPVIPQHLQIYGSLLGFVKSYVARDPARLLSRPQVCLMNLIWQIRIPLCCGPSQTSEARKVID